MTNTNSATVSVVVAWTEDTRELAPGQKAWRADLGDRPVWIDVRKAHAAMWVGEGTSADVEAAQAWVDRTHYGFGRVYVYPTSETDPLNRARREILA
jgi:hypothetical protein